MSEEYRRRDSRFDEEFGPIEDRETELRWHSSAETFGINFTYASEIENIVREYHRANESRADTADYSSTFFSAQSSEMAQEEFILGVKVENTQTNFYLLGVYTDEGDAIPEVNIERQSPSGLTGDIEEERDADKVQWLEPEDIEREPGTDELGGNAQEALRQFFPNYEWDFK